MQLSNRFPIRPVAGCCSCHSFVSSSFLLSSSNINFGLSERLRVYRVCLWLQWAIMNVGRLLRTEASVRGRRGRRPRSVVLQAVDSVAWVWISEVIYCRERRTEAVLWAANRAREEGLKIEASCVNLPSLHYGSCLSHDLGALLELLLFEDLSFVSCTCKYPCSIALHKVMKSSFS